MRRPSHLRQAPFLIDFVAPHCAVFVEPSLHRKKRRQDNGHRQRAVQNLDIPVPKNCNGEGNEQSESVGAHVVFFKLRDKRTRDLVADGQEQAVDEAIKNGEDSHFADTDN